MKANKPVPKKGNCSFDTSFKHLVISCTVQIDLRYSSNEIILNSDNYGPELALLEHKIFRAMETPIMDQT